MGKVQELGVTVDKRRDVAGNMQLSTIPSRWRLPVRIMVVSMALTGVGLLLGALPARLAQLQTICVDTVCSAIILVPADAAILSNWGISPTVYALYHIAIEAILVVPAAILWWYVFRRYAHSWIGAITCAALVYLAVLLGNIVWAWTQISEPAALISDVVTEIGASALILLLFLFPDGRLQPRWARFVIFYLICVALPFGFVNLIISPGLDSNLPDTLNALSFFVLVLLGGAAQIVRYRRQTDAVQRQQTKWVVVGFSGLMLGVVLWFTTMEAFPFEPGAPRLLWNVVGMAVMMSLTAALPVGLGFAMLRYRLWDVDLYINRALVYASATALITLTYIVLIGGLSTLFHIENNLLLSFVVTGVVALAFLPVRERLEKGVNRWLYGERDNPLLVMTKLGEVLVSAENPTAILPTYAQTIADALLLPAVAIWMRVELDRYQPVAQVGQQPDHVEMLPLIYHEQHVGQLVVAPRVGQKAFSRADRRLLAQIANQTAVAVNTVRLARDLQQSHARLVTMREEERRRLRRDLHDGLGPVLASQGLKLSAARQLLDKRPAAARQLLDEVNAQNERTVAEVRRLVYGLRPPALDELGLIGAITQEGRRVLGAVALAVTNSPQPLPPLSAAVEVAAFRIALEALTNVARHAHASHCKVKLSVFDEVLTLTVQDDGRGLAEARTAGVGLQSMRERAAELGGSCRVTSPPLGGTLVVARLPIVLT